MDAQRSRIIPVAVENANNAAMMMFHVVHDHLMVELRREDPTAFNNFMRMHVAMYDELVQRLTPRLTNFR